MKINGDLKFRTLGSGELQNAIIERLAGGALGGSLPTGVAGRIVYNTDTQSYWYYAAGATNAWVEFGAGADLTNVINSGGYMNVDGTFDATAFSGFTNINAAGSPLANLVEALSQLDDAISTAAGVDTLKELTDVDVDGESDNGTAAPAYADGQLLYYDSGNSRWTTNDTSSIANGDFLTWDGSSWVTTQQSAVLSLSELNDVIDTVTSGATDGQVLAFDGDAGSGDEWRSVYVNFIRTSDGFTNIDLSGGSLNPDGDGGNILFNIDISGVETQVASFTSTELDLTAPDGTTGAAVDINAGAGTAGEGGDVTINAGSSTSGEGGDITLTAGTLTGGNSGDVSLLGGGTTAARAGVLVGGGGASSAGGNLDLWAGNDSGTDGQVSIYSGSSGAGTGVIQIQTAGRIQNKSPYIEVVHTTAANAGVVRFQEGTTNGTDYVGLKAPDAVTTPVTYTLPVAPSANYLLQTTAGGVLSWVDPAAIGGDSFATWASATGTGGAVSGDGSIIADSTTDTATLTAGAGVNLNLNATSDIVTFSLQATALSDVAVAGADVITFFDGGPGGTLSRTTLTSFLASLDIPNAISTNGIVVRTAADTYTSRSIAASAVNDELGITITNGDGVSGNPTVGLDIVGLTDIGSTPQSVDELVIYDVTGTANRSVTVGDLTAGIVGAGLNLTDLENVTITGATAGDILYVTDGSPEMWANSQPGATTGVQPYDASLASISGLALTVNDFLYVTDGSPETFSTLASGTTGRDLLGDETVGDAITTLGLDSGGVSDIWVDVAGDTMTGDLTMLDGGAGSPVLDARVLMSGGSATRPSLAYTNDTDTGMYLSGAGGGGIAFSTGGVLRFSLDSVSNDSEVPFRVSDGTAGTPAYSFINDTNTGLYLISSDLLGFSTTGVERLRMYGAGVAGSPETSIAGALSVENTASYENLIPDPATSGFTFPVDDFLPNAQWVDLYYLKKSGGSMSGDIVMGGNDINMAGGSITNLSDPSSALDATNKNYVDNLVSSGAVWVNPIRNPDLVGISADEVLNPLSSGAYIAYGGTYPQFWATDAGSPATGSPQFIEVNEYDVMHYTFGAWEKSTNLLTGFSNPRFGAGIFTNALDTTPGQNLDGTGIQENDLVEYIGTGSPNDPFDPANWDFPHGRVGGVTFGVISVTAATDTFVIEGDQSASFHVGNTFLYSGSGSPGGSGSPSVAGTYTIQSVTVTSTSPLTTEVVVDEDVTEDVTGGYAEPELRDGITTLTSNEDDSHFGQSYLYVADNNEWVQISGPGNVDAGVGLSYQGNTLNVNLGAGIFELPGDEVGIELYNSASGAIILTTDGSTRDNGTASRLHLLLDATGGLDQGVAGLEIASGGVTNDMLENGSGINISGDAGTPTDVPLGGSVTFNGTDGVVVTVGAGGGSPSALDVTVDLDSVPNSALTFSSIGLADGVSAVDEVALGEDIDVSDGGIASGSNSLKFRRIEDIDGDTYVETSTAVGDDGDTVTIEAAGVANGTFSAAGVSLSGAAIDIDATGGTVAIDATAAASLTGGVDVNLVATTGDALVHAVAGSIELDASTAVEVLGNVDLRLMDADNSAYIGHKSNAVVTSSITYEWPEAPAGNDYVLVSSTGGVMSWSSPSEVGRTRLEDLDDVVVNVGSPGEGYVAGDVLVANTGSPNQFESKSIQYIYDSTLTGSPSVGTSHTINHNLGQQFVNVTVYNTSNEQIVPQGVTLNSANQLIVTFNAAIDCKVVIVGVAGVTAGDGA